MTLSIGSYSIGLNGGSNFTVRVTGRSQEEVNRISREKTVEWSVNKEIFVQYAKKVLFINSDYPSLVSVSYHEGGYHLRFEQKALEIWAGRLTVLSYGHSYLKKLGFF
jgi:hypothetical protein